MPPTTLALAEHAVVAYHHTPPAGVAIEALLDPAYWAHVAPKLRPGYRIEVLAEDGAYWAMLLVRAAGKTEAKVQVLQHIFLGPQAEALDEGDYEVKWRGPTKKWGIVRRSDAEVIRDEFAVKEEAEGWLRTYLVSPGA